MATMLVSLGGMVTMMSSTVMAPALPTIARDLHINQSTTNMTLSIFVLGFGLGPMVLAPMVCFATHWSCFSLAPSGHASRHLEPLAIFMSSPETRGGGRKRLMCRIQLLLDSKALKHLHQTGTSLMPHCPYFMTYCSQKANCGIFPE